MKQKIDNSQLVTKKDLDDRFNRVVTAFRNEIHFEFRTMRDVLDDQLKKFSNIVHNAIAPLTKDIETRNQEKAVGANQIHGIREEISVIKKRIKRLEQTPSAV